MKCHQSGPPGYGDLGIFQGCLVMNTFFLELYSPGAPTLRGLYTPSVWYEAPCVARTAGLCHMHTPRRVTLSAPFCPIWVTCPGTFYPQILREPHRTHPMPST